MCKGTAGIWQGAPDTDMAPAGDCHRRTGRGDATGSSCAGGQCEPPQRAIQPVSRPNRGQPADALIEVNGGHVEQSRQAVPGR